MSLTIENEFMDCCNGCKYLEPECKCDRLFFGNDVALTNVKVYCEHRQVCHNLLESIEKQKLYTPDDVMKKLVIHGQNSRDFAWGEAIRYSPHEVKKILEEDA